MVSKSFEGQTDKTEEWYGTQYKQEAITDLTIEVNHCGHSVSEKITHNTVCSDGKTNSYTTLLADCIPAFQKWASADLNGKFKLPMKNEFIPTNFEIYPLEKDSSSVPTLIKASAVVLSVFHFLTALEKPPLTAHC